MAAIESRHRRNGRWRGALAGLSVLLALAGVPGTAAGAAPDTDGDGLHDAFEVRYGFDPARRDTDGDGVRDPAEDEDDDRLGALGEQRSRTSPLLPDTDGDGIRDGREDADGDGIDNAHQQDRRRAPSRLVPSLARVEASIPQPYVGGCHSLHRDPRIHPCPYGRPDAPTTIVVLGDSHAAQWVPTLIRAAADRDWRIVSITKSACPAAAIAAPRWTVDGSCDDWRAAAVRWIGNHPPSLVVMTSSLVYQRRGPGGRLQDRSLSRTEWVEAVRTTVTRMPAGVPVLVLADTPRMGRMIPACLARNLGNLSRCGNPRARAMSPETAAAERGAVEAEGAGYVSFNPLLCPYDPCPALNDNVIIWRDHAHITRRMAEMVWRPVADAVAAALEPPAPAAARRHPRTKRRR